MKDLLVIALIGLLAWIFIRVMTKEPIIPFKKADAKKAANAVQNTKGKKGKKSKKKEVVTPESRLAEMEQEEEEAIPFDLLFPDFVGLETHMIRMSNNHFTMMAEVLPVNYFLRDPEEQETIDAAFETWTATLPESTTRIYFQNRFVDLTEQIEEMQREMDEAEDMNTSRLEYGQYVIKDLQQWQKAQPRYDTKYYVLFDFQVNAKDIRLEEGDVLEERIIEKAFNELQRRVSAARQYLRKGEMDVLMLSEDGIVETSYYAFNRRKATKNRYRDIERQEKLAIYVTADQEASLISRVKGELEDVQ